MEPRNCSNIHFFQAIRGGEVIKVCNIDSTRKPAVKLKTLKDVHESEDAKRLGRHSTIDLQLKCTGSIFYNDPETGEPLYLPLADRILREIKPEFDFSDDDDGSDLDDNTTLKQLTERSKTKKRKLGSSTGANRSQADADGELAEDESDKKEPLITWKSMLEKNSMDSRKCAKRNLLTSLQASSSILSKQNHLAMASMHVDDKLPLFSCVKVEDPEAELQESQIPSSVADNLPAGLNEDSNPDGVTSNGISVECENRQSGFFGEECQNCVTNEVSYDHLDLVSPISMIFASNERPVKVEYQEMDSSEFLALPPSVIEIENDSSLVLPSRSSPAKVQSSYMCSNRSSSKAEETSDKSSGNSSDQVPNTAFDNNTGCIEPCNGDNFSFFQNNTGKDLVSEIDGSLSSTDKNYTASLSSSISLEINALKDTIADEEEVFTFPLDAVERNGLNFGNQLDNDISVSKKRQTPAAPGTYRERKPFLQNQSCDITNTLPTPELCQPPQRLLSTRKAISPSSQQRLCLNRKSAESCDNVDQYECKGAFWLEKQDENKVSSVKSDIEHATVTKNVGELEVENHRKFILCPGQILKKPKNWKAPLPKGNLEGPRISCPLPSFSSGCTSTKGFSESAIAFSQRQMHDIESLAMKLMNELKFMKDIVEGKLLFEVYRNTSLRSDVEQVRTAVGNAIKVEEMARKWLSVMTRDCNRFCKIMQLTQNSITASSNTVHRERKKIVFADEAGGKLCDVKFFEYDTASPVSASDAELQQG